MSTEHFVTCRHCGVGIIYICDHDEDDVPAEDYAALQAENDRLRESLVMAGVCLAHKKLSPIDLASIPVHYISLLPRGRIFMHPDTPTSGARDPWPPPGRGLLADESKAYGEILGLEFDRPVNDGR